MRDKLTVEVAKAKEYADITEFLRNTSFTDAFELGRVHFNDAMFDYHSKEVNFFFVEKGFGRL